MRKIQTHHFVPGKFAAKSILHRLAAALLLGAFLFGLNLHLFFLQLFGWSGMLIEYRQESGSWITAIEQTIQGETPCSVCLQVETALNADERRSESIPSGTDNRILPPLLLPLAKGVPVVEAPAPTHLLPIPLDKTPLSPIPDPRTPPPRQNLA